MGEMGNAQEDLLNIGRKRRNVKLNVGLGLGRIAVAPRGPPDSVLGPAVGGRIIAIDVGIFATVGGAIV